jgi:large subunit ribosomal protein L15
MQLHEARRADLSNKKKVRVGRGPGSGLGKTAGRGIKGATSRSGYAMKVTYEGGQMPLFRRLPKRGFGNGRFKVTYTGVNVGDLSIFPANSTVGIDELREEGLAHGPRHMPVKILGDGELSVALNISADAFSKSAIEKIQKAGGKVEWLGGAPKKKAPNFKRIEAEKKLAEKAKPAGGKPEGKAEGKPEGKGGEGKPAKPEGKGGEGKLPKAEGKPEGKAPEAKPEGKAEAKPAENKPKAEKPAPKADEKPPEAKA